MVQGRSAVTACCVCAWQHLQHSVCALCIGSVLSSTCNTVYRPCSVLSAWDDMTAGHRRSCLRFPCCLLVSVQRRCKKKTKNSCVRQHWFKKYVNMQSAAHNICACIQHSACWHIHWTFIASADASSQDTHPDIATHSVSMVQNCKKSA